jgi:AbrB family looped-hinge helix DNA binding protein
MREFNATITSKGQVTIPAEVRRELGVGRSDKVTFVIRDEGGVEVRPAKKSFLDLRGSLPPLPGRETVDFDDWIYEAQQEMADKVLRDIKER